MTSSRSGHELILHQNLRGLNDATETPEVFRIWPPVWHQSCLYPSTIFQYNEDLKSSLACLCNRSRVGLYVIFYSLVMNWITGPTFCIIKAAPLMRKVGPVV